MTEIKSSESYRKKAREAANKPATYGEDIDLSEYSSSAEQQAYMAEPGKLSSEAKKKMLEAGVELEDISRRSGTYIHMNNTPVHSSIQGEGVEVMPVSKALEKHDWLADYWWKATEVDTDKYTASIELSGSDGYFIRTLPGHKTLFPVQTCLYMEKAKFAQNVHNIIIAEEGSELDNYIVHVLCKLSLFHIQTGLHRKEGLMTRQCPDKISVASA